MTGTPDRQPESWQLTDLLERAPGLQVLADTLADLADEGHPIVAGTADLKYSNGLVRFEHRHPDKYVQFGISEQHMVSAAAGMATAGLKPYVATFASFLALLACEQIRTDIAYPGLPVRLIGHHSGITLGFYGTSHHALEDLAIMRSIAGLTVVAPADANSLAALLRRSISYPGPMYIRIGRGQEPDLYGPTVEFQVGKAIVHHIGQDVTIVATGSMVHPATQAAAALAKEGLDVGVIDMHTIKPIDQLTIKRAAVASPLLVSVEEHSVLGGLGGAIAEILADGHYSARLHRHGIHDQYSLIGPPTHLYRHYHLDAEGIASVVREQVGAPEV
ncbi:transketolase family protein [Kitasatospora aureofaciens]|uniref:transketolase family protein n=1 Tax=Kitasatospora aureofaciens TaxID=1894 RepID=UPI0036F49CC4